MKYLDMQACSEFVFPFIHDALTAAEPAPQYEEEAEGMADLVKVLNLVQVDTYYAGFADKAAYILCSIAGSQYFSNGNKRLGVMTLLAFLIVNNTELRIFTDVEYREILQEYFPSHTWDQEAVIPDGHPLFLYNLAIAIGDRKQWDGGDFTTLREKVSAMFTELYRLPSV